MSITNKIYFSMLINLEEKSSWAYTGGACVPTRCGREDIVNLN